MLRSQLTDGTGTKRSARVDDLSSLVVSLNPCPPILEQKNRIFRQYLTADGTSSGSTVMKVNGAVTSVEFWVPAHAVNDRFITAVSFVISDATPTLNKFGTITALTNGCDFEYRRRAGEVVIIHGDLKTNWDFIRMCMGYPAFGDAANAFQATNIVGTSEGYIPVFNFLAVMPPFGLKLDAGSDQRLILRVNDDLTGVDGFDAISYGFERLP